MLKFETIIRNNKTMECNIEGVSNNINNNKTPVSWSLANLSLTKIKVIQGVNN